MAAVFFSQCENKRGCVFVKNLVGSESGKNKYFKIVKTVFTTSKPGHAIFNCIYIKLTEVKYMFTYVYISEEF